MGSQKAAVRVLRRAMRQRAGEDPTPLQERLGTAVKDSYVRHGGKQARAWPHKRKQGPPGEPLVLMASDAEVAMAKEFHGERAVA